MCVLLPPFRNAGRAAAGGKTRNPTDETYVSAKQDQACTHTRFSCPYGDESRAPRFEAPSRQRPRQAHAPVAPRYRPRPTIGRLLYLQAPKRQSVAQCRGVRPRVQKSHAQQGQMVYRTRPEERRRYRPARPGDIEKTLPPSDRQESNKTYRQGVVSTTPGGDKRTGRGCHQPAGGHRGHEPAVVRQPGGPLAALPGRPRQR